MHRPPGTKRPPSLRDGRFVFAYALLLNAWVGQEQAQREAFSKREAIRNARIEALIRLSSP